MDLHKYFGDDGQFVAAPGIDLEVGIEFEAASAY